jgi:hypothetical protein
MKSLNFTPDTARTVPGVMVVGAVTTVETTTVVVVGRNAVWLSGSPTTTTGKGMSEWVTTTAGAGEG